MHCLTGCSIGELRGMVIGTAFGAPDTISITIAGVAAFPANRWLLARGRGHAVVHAYHAH